MYNHVIFSTWDIQLFRAIIMMVFVPKLYVAEVSQDWLANDVECIVEADNN